MNVNWEEHSSANVLEKEDLTCYSFAAFSNCKKDGLPVDCPELLRSSFMGLLHFRIPASIIFTRSLFKSGLLYEALTCKESLISFSKGDVWVIACFQLLCHLGGITTLTLFALIFPRLRIRRRRLILRYRFSWL